MKTERRFAVCRNCQSIITYDEKDRSEYEQDYASKMCQCGCYMSISWNESPQNVNRLIKSTIDHLEMKMAKKEELIADLVAERKHVKEEACEKCSLLFDSSNEGVNILLKEWENGRR